jgi:hypothetical protein
LTPTGFYSIRVSIFFKHKWGDKKYAALEEMAIIMPVQLGCRGKLVDDSNKLLYIAGNSILTDRSSTALRRAGQLLKIHDAHGYGWVDPGVG